MDLNFFFISNTKLIMITHIFQPSNHQSIQRFFSNIQTQNIQIKKKEEFQGQKKND